MIAYDLYVTGVATLVAAIYVASVIVRERIERRKRFQKPVERRNICPFCGADLEGKS
jgi:formate dehydrogenase maturation protein FdhE